MRVRGCWGEWLPSSKRDCLTGFCLNMWLVNVKLNSVASHVFVQKGLSLSPSDSPSALGGGVWMSYPEIPELPVEYARRIWLS